MKNLIETFKNLPKIVALTIASLVAFIVFIYYPIGMVWVHKVDDSATFSAKKYEAKDGSYAASMAMALVDREVNIHRWTSNDPIIFPGALLIRMPAFQRGVMASVSRFTVTLSDYLGRARGSSQIDTDLQNAAGLFKYSPYVWIWNWQVSWLPTASTEKQYQSGIDSLMEYNKRLATGKANFERRSDNLMLAMDGIASDIGSASAALDEYIITDENPNFNSAAELFYYNKGLMYGNYMLLKELEKDYADVIKEKQLATVWKDMLSSLEHGMQLSNFMIFNFAPDSQFLPNHLTAQGFYLMRARTQMREVTNILLK